MLPSNEGIWNKGYGVIILVQDINKKTLSRDPTYIVELVMERKFEDSSISTI